MGSSPYFYMTTRVIGRELRAQRGVHLTMRTLREAAGKTQTEVAEASKIDQADISRLEGRENLADCQVSTLQRYVAALGGQLELVAAFGNKRIILSSVAQAGPSGDAAPAKSSPSKREAARGWSAIR